MRAAEDPEVGLGQFALGVPTQEEVETGIAGGPANASVSELAEKVVDVMEDQASRGQLVKLSEAEAKVRFPNLVVASLGANRKDKPGRVVTAWLLFDRTFEVGLVSSGLCATRDSHERREFRTESDMRYHL